MGKREKPGIKQAASKSAILGSHLNLEDGDNMLFRNVG
jgi:hypothetical protein